jgi:hypothetical protein
MVSLGIQHKGLHRRYKTLLTGTEALNAGIDGPPLMLIMGGVRWKRLKKKTEIFIEPKIYPSLSGLETSADVFFGHLRETEGGFRISVLWYWHAFDFPLLRAQNLRKGKTLFCGSE